MGAINKDQSYRKGECVLCMDCVYTCPSGGVEFSFPERESKRYFSTAGSGTATGRTGKGIGRAEFILLLLSSVFLSGAAKRKKERTGSDIVRPPGALKEEEFLSRCVRCGNCMKVCPTNVIQPVLFQSGIEGIWSPHLVYDIGYCEYNCDLCGEVCPTGAIPDLRIDLKKRTKLGLARVNKGKCIAWADDQQCLVCEEHCPVPQKAIKISEIAVNGRTVGRPVIDERLCIGCGICQNKCPVRPVRAVRVYPAGAERM
jgi:MauM/NapG family ferredoxin protein